MSKKGILIIGAGGVSQVATVKCAINIDTFEIFVEMDSEGLESILSIEVEILKDIKRVLKKLMGLYLDAVL